MSVSHIPLAVEQQAMTTITAMVERGLDHPERLRHTCKSIALVILSKWNIADKKMMRILTNMMINKAYDVTYRNE